MKKYVAASAALAHYAMTCAFAAAPLTVTQPVTFLQLVWAVKLGAVAFNETNDAYVIFGGAIIKAAFSFSTWRAAGCAGRNKSRSGRAPKLAPATSGLAPTYARV